MRILHLVGGYGDEHLGGAIHREMAQLILAAGHAYEILAPVHARHMSGRSEVDVEAGVRVHRVVCAGRPHLDVINAIARRIFRFPWFVTSFLGFRRVLFRSPPPDVILAEGAYPLGAQVEIATRRSRVPFVVSVIGGDFIANDAASYGYGRYALARALMRRAFARASAVRAVSPYAARRAEALGCAPGKIAIVQRNIARGCYVPQGVDVAAFRAAARERVVQTFALAGGKLVVAVGRLVPIKGFDDLLRALPMVVLAAGECCVLLIGPNRSDARLGDYRQYLERLSRELGAPSRMTIAGALSHERVRDALAAADVVAVPSLEEGGSKMVMEAAAVGTPVVATSNSGTIEWASAWGSAIAVEPGHPQGLASGLIRVLQNPATASSMGARGRHFAERFRPEPVSERILGVCAAAAGGVPVPSQLRSPRELERAVEDETVA